MTDIFLLIHRYIKDGEVTHYGVHTPDRRSLVPADSINDFVDLGNVVEDYNYDLVHAFHIPLEWKNQPEDWIREHVTVYDHIEFKNN